MEKPTPLLWNSNHPRNFWCCQPDFPAETWAEAIRRALPTLGLPETMEIESVLEWTLGEGQFGPNRYHLGLLRRVYYQFKPLIPRTLIRLLRQMYNGSRGKEFLLNWPIEERFVQFQWEIIRQGLIISGQNEINFRYFWPEGKNFAFVLTHDIESAKGQRLVPVLADMEEALGFRSLFNFVPELYPLDQGLIKDLRQRGFEIGIHGLKHDGKLFNSYNGFSQRAKKINRYLKDFRSTGFRSPLTLRNPAWMQRLEMDYDLSFFDTDPYEPMPGGVMSIWPFTIGHFTELPYTLTQDYTMFNLLGETSPRIWLEKIYFLEKYHGMALVNVHPDYSSRGASKQIYESFLQKIKDRGGYWHALPGEVASWWKNRADLNNDYSGNDQKIATAKIALNGDDIEITICGEPVNPVLHTKTLLAPLGSIC
jgi:peptidoglycan/xylan/chitin deacetylase (PgdA/CDA1 family)